MIYFYTHKLKIKRLGGDVRQLVPVPVTCNVKPYAIGRCEVGIGVEDSY